MVETHKDLRERVTDVAGKAGERAAEVRDEVRAKGEQAVATSAKGAREVAAGAKRNKTAVAVTSATAAVAAAIVAAWKIIRRRKS